MKCSIMYKISFQETKPGHVVLGWKIFLQVKWLIPTASLALVQSLKLSRPHSWECYFLKKGNYENKNKQHIYLVLILCRILVNTVPGRGKDIYSEQIIGGA